MGTNLSPLDDALYRGTDEVLHYKWDPIGISDFPEARDEYHQYLPQVFGLLKGDADAAKIAAYLSEITTERMGLKKNHQHDIQIAELLLDLQRFINGSDT